MAWIHGRFELPSIDGYQGLNTLDGDGDGSEMRPTLMCNLTIPHVTLIVDAD